MATAAPKDQGQLCYPYGSASSDEETLSEILNALHHHSGIPQERIRVEVRHGRVVLSGVVEQPYERELVEQVATTTPGVVDVVNNMSLES